MQRKSAVDIVQRFWDEVWRSPQNPAALDQLVREDFVITKIKDLQFEVIDMFQSGRHTRCDALARHRPQQPLSLY